MHSWRWLFMHIMPCAFAFALPSAGNSKAARIAMIAITTSSSISVNPLGKREQFFMGLSFSTGGARVGGRGLRD